MAADAVPLGCNSQHKGYRPQTVWDASMVPYLRAAFGQQGLQRLSSALTRPPLSTTLRVNTLRQAPQVAMQQLQQELAAVSAAWSQPCIEQLAELPEVLQVRGTGPHDLDYGPAEGREVVVSRKTAEAVLRGAHVFLPGVLAASSALQAGDLVAVSTILEAPGSTSIGVNRGTVLEDAAPGSLAAADRSHLHIGLGRLQVSRRELFQGGNGVAVALLRRAFEVPPCNGLLPGRVVLQNLPSIVAAQVLGPPPGARVLDMCAAPGGKTTMLAQMMGDQGSIVALDRSFPKAQEIRTLAAELGCTCITAYRMDASKACRQPAAQQPAAAAPQPGEPATAAQQGAWVEGMPMRLNPKVARRRQRKAQIARDKREGCALTLDVRCCPAALQFRQQHKLPPGCQPAQAPEGPVCEGFPPASFPFILLDAPCTALGLRPRLTHHATLKFVQGSAAYQRNLMHVAVQLLQPGGVLVYSTCSISPVENESNVRYLLDRYPELQLVPQKPYLGGPGLVGCFTHLDGSTETWLTDQEAALVQRFDPAADLDTPGFFIAKFQKQDRP